MLRSELELDDVFGKSDVEARLKIEVKYNNR